MLVLVNGDARELATGTTVAGIVASLPGVPEGRGVAVALDGEVVPRGRWDQTELIDGARIEVVVAVQGG
ncbi:MAG TPA: sulfur carrier protein ThiS [Solirubrobacteraceae bacterium]